MEAEKTKNDIRIIKKVKIYCLYDSVADSLFLPYVLKVSESQNEIFCLQISQKANQILDRFLPYDARAEIPQEKGSLFGRFEFIKISF